MVAGGSVGFNGVMVFEHRSGTEGRGNRGGEAGRGSVSGSDGDRWWRLRPKEGEEGAGRMARREADRAA
jgi:hypothetical protein